MVEKAEAPTPSAVRTMGSPTFLPSMRTWNEPVGAAQVSAVVLALRMLKVSLRRLPAWPAALSWVIWVQVPSSARWPHSTPSMVSTAGTGLMVATPLAW